MRIHFLLLLLTTVSILTSGCAGRRHRETDADYSDYSYWRAPGSCSDPNCTECNQSAAGSALEPSQSFSGVLNRYNPFKNQSEQIADEGSLKCEGCQQQTDVLMDGHCVDCLKQRIDERVLGVRNVDTDRNETSPANRLNAGFLEPQSPQQPVIPNKVVDEGSAPPQSLEVAGPTGEPVRAKLGRRGESFIPPSNAAAKKDLNPIVEPNSATDLLTVVDQLPEKEFDPALLNNARKTSSKSTDAYKKQKELADESDDLADSQDATFNPISKTFRLDQLLPGLLKSPEPKINPETAGKDSIPDTDDIEWGPPMPVRARLPRPANDTNDSPPLEIGDEDQPPPSEPPPNFQRTDGHAYAAPTKRSERDIIRDLRNSTIPNSIVFDNTPDIPEQQFAEKKILLTAKPVLGYHAPQILAESDTPAQAQSADDDGDRLESWPRRIQALPVSVGKTKTEPEFDFRPLPELTQPSTLGSRAFDPNELIEEIFEPISFPVVPSTDSATPDNRRNINGLAPPVTIQGDLKVLNPHSLKSRLPKATPTEDNILLHAVSQGDSQEAISGGGSRTGSQANFKLKHPD